MNLHNMLKARAAEGNPVRIGLIGAGKFGAMFLAQARTTTGMHIVGIADLNPEQAKVNCLRTGWSEEQLAASNLSDARSSGKTCILEDSDALIRHDGLEVLIEATGDPAAGIAHCLNAIENGRHIVMVNVEADVVAGPLLAQKAKDAGVCYSLAYGDQPSLVCEHVDWAQACGFRVVCAGKGTRYHPDFHDSTPETVWENFGWTPEFAERGGMNPKMFNSFIDGTKSGIEMTASCNATGLTPQPDGLGFPPSPRMELAEVCKPQEFGGTLTHSGTTEVVSSLDRDLQAVPNHLQMGTYVVIEADTDYVKHCFEEYYMLPDSSFQFAALYRPIHLIGLELGISVASVVLRNDPTGTPTGFRSDVAATAKRNLRAGEILDGEGGFTVWGKQTPTEVSLREGYLPLGLSGNVKLLREVPQGERLRWQDVEMDLTSPVVCIRREMEAAFGPQS